MESGVVNVYDVVVGMSLALLAIDEALAKSVVAVPTSLTPL